MRSILFLLFLLAFSSELAAKESSPFGVYPTRFVAVGASDSVAIPVTAGPDIDPGPLKATLEKGVEFRLLDTAARIISANETLEFVVIFTPPSVGTFSDVITFSYMNAQGQIMTSQVQLVGEGIAATVHESGRATPVIWPNPADRLVNLSKIAKQVTMIDLRGSEVGQFHDVDHLDVSHLPAGRYQLVIESRGGEKKSMPLTIAR
jgi:hypothetical protein